MLIVSSAWLSLLLSIAFFLFHSFYSLTPEFLFSSFLWLSFLSAASHLAHVYCFPDFYELSKFSCSLLIFFKTIILNCQACYRSPSLWVGCWKIILFFWWCKFLGFFFLSYCILTLLSVHLKGRLCLPDFMVWLQWGKELSSMSGFDGTSWVGYSSSS